MIGVVAKPGETAAVEEFFQLFKTPWESYREGCPYDVVITTTGEVPDVDAVLLIVFGSAPASVDAPAGIVPGSKSRGAVSDRRGSRLPIYGELLTFKPAAAVETVLTIESAVGGVRIHSSERTLLRLGFDLFREVEYLLSAGQPLENAAVPTLDLHIAMLRNWILEAGVGLLEIPPVPAGHDFAVCLTHDIDFIGIRDHKFDHTMFGFLYRATFGSLRDFARQRMSLGRLLRNLRAAASLPFVHLGLARDFWLPFEWYLRVEKNLSATYFLIPFKKRAGERVAAKNPQRRATAYDITDIPEWTSQLTKEGCEIGVHGIDAWHSIEKGRDERQRISRVTGDSEIGVRMHWLQQDQNTYHILEEAGYAYDSTAGYNDTIGYRSGTTQVFRPVGARRLLELPMHIQDGALFYPQKLDLSEREATECCEGLIQNARRFGGTLTVLWHDRSHAPERFWGDFYERLVERLKACRCWFGTAGHVVNWFRQRREVTFERVESDDGISRTRIRYSGAVIEPPLVLRRHVGDGDMESRDVGQTVDVVWRGDSEMEFGDHWASHKTQPAGAALVRGEQLG
ncbi:MAG TPA: hypothetical protein VJW76_01305 [Verrucomicrobiae bacterium]|nr:hypothetical protein [Verrucomicrobiae bacterium]